MVSRPGAKCQLASSETSRVLGAPAARYRAANESAAPTNAAVGGRVGRTARAVRTAGAADIRCSLKAIIFALRRRYTGNRLNANVVALVWIHDVNAHDQEARGPQRGGAHLHQGRRRGAHR